MSFLSKETNNMSTFCSIGKNSIIGQGITFGSNVTISHNCVIEDNVNLGDNVLIECNSIVRSNVIIGEGSYIGSNCIVGEFIVDNKGKKMIPNQKLSIGKNSVIRSGSIIYTNSIIGDNFVTGHQVVVREKSRIGNHVSVGTLSDIQGNCDIGNYVRLHSSVHIGQLSKIDDFVWIFPYVVLTNDPTPPSEDFLGVHVRSFAIIATGAIIMPGLEIGQDSLVGAGAIVTKSVPSYAVNVGNPAKQIADVRTIRSKVTGEPVYPWRYHFDNYMPWTGSDFDKWYSSLDLETKKQHKIDHIAE